MCVAYISGYAHKIRKSCSSIVPLLLIMNLRSDHTGIVHIIINFSMAHAYFNVNMCLSMWGDLFLDH